MRGTDDSTRKILQCLQHALDGDKERSSYLEMLHLLKTRIQVYTEE